MIFPELAIPLLTPTLTIHDIDAPSGRRPFRGKVSLVRFVFISLYFVQ